jgi:hypothetical protein
VWLSVLSTCVCMSVFDFRAYDVQLKTKLQFNGRVNILSISPFNLLCCHSSLDLSWNQLQQLPPGVFSSLTSLRSLTSPVWLNVLRTCVCIAVFDFRAAHIIVSLKQNYILEEG